jgi:hypothetical protein
MEIVDFGTSDLRERTQYKNFVGIALGHVDSPLITVHGDTYKTSHHSSMFLGVYTSGNATIVLTQDTPEKFPDSIDARFKISSKSDLEEKAIARVIQGVIDDLVAARPSEPNHQ